jgi:hypothetical protein
MKIVINKCYGGFSLSPKAVARLAELKGKKAYFFKGGFGSSPRTPFTLDDIPGLIWMAYSVPNPPAGPSATEWHAMTTEQRHEVNAAVDAVRLSTRPGDRADPDLVQVVEELGEAANGFGAELDVVEVPDGVDWEIAEYDGMEHIAEKHRTWY